MGGSGIEWGVYGVPETFVVDRQGQIRYRHVGQLTEADLKQRILPLIAKLDREQPRDPLLRVGGPQQ